MNCLILTLRLREFRLPTRTACRERDERVPEAVDVDEVAVDLRHPHRADMTPRKEQTPPLPGPGHGDQKGTE